MKNVVFLIDFSYPYVGAVATCCFNLATEVAKHHRVTVICRKSIPDQPPEETYHGLRIIRVHDRLLDVQLRLEGQLRSADSPPVWKQGQLKAIKGIGALRRAKGWAGIDSALTKAYLNALMQAADTPIDAVVPFYNPIEALAAAVKFKALHPKVKLIPYIYDKILRAGEIYGLLGLTESVKALRRTQRPAFEATVIHHSDRVMVVHSQEDHFREAFPGAAHKIEFIEHPLIKSLVEEDPVMEDDTPLTPLSLVYTGALAKGYVEPDYMLKLVNLAATHVDLRLDMFGKGDCDDVIRQYEDSSLGRIKHHGYITKTEALQRVLQAHILVNVAEVDGKQISSKIFEYMSAGKPIVHFYSSDADINKTILRNYPLSLALKQDEELLVTNVRKFVDFVQQHRGTRLPFAAVQELYAHATPQAAAASFLDAVLSRGHRDRYPPNRN